MLSTPCVSHDQETSQSVHPHCNKPLFLGILIFQRKSVVVFESGYGISKVHLMLSDVLFRLVLIPLLFHKTIVPPDLRQGKRTDGTGQSQ